MRSSHWMDLLSQTGQSAEDFDLKKLTLTSVFQMQLHRFPEKVSEIVTTAQKQMQIEKSLQNVEGVWKSMNLVLKAYKGTPENPRGYTLLPNEEMRTTLDDNVMELQNMGSSQYALALLDSIKNWEKKLSTVSEVFDAWQVLQRKWVYLESIFLDSDDIRLQLPEEAKKFERSHKLFVGIMKKTHDSPGVLGACCQDGRLDEFKALTAEFDRIQKSLTEYLDTKRSAFPRFYMISDEELLSILGTSDPTGVQAHMRKMYDNCKSLEFRRAESVLGMYSDENEYLKFHSAQKAEGSVEDWMRQVEEQMRDTLQRISKVAIFNYASKERVPWLQEYVGMVAIVGTQIWWTWGVKMLFAWWLRGTRMQ